MAATLLVATTDMAIADGAAIFESNCAFCHQAGGVGVPGQFPRLAGRIGAVADKPEGKKFLPQVLLGGMSGRISVDGEQVLGIMPAFDTLSDDDIAGLLTYLTGLDHAAVPYTADEIKQVRDQIKAAPNDVMAQRAALAAAKVIP